jgi:hypothetical protein
LEHYYQTRIQLFIDHAATQFDVIHIPWKDAPATKASSWLAALSNVAGGSRQARKRVPAGFSYGIDESNQRRRRQETAKLNLMFQHVLNDTTESERLASRK